MGEFALEPIKVEEQCAEFICFARLPEVMGQVLEKVADLYEDQVEISIMTTMALFEPVIICVFGAFVLIIVLAIYMPIFTVSSAVR